jgi:hypothetical protein
MSRALCSIRLAIVFCTMPKGTRSGPGFPPGSAPLSALLCMANSVLIRAKMGLELTAVNSIRQKNEKK